MKSTNSKNLIITIHGVNKKSESNWQYSFDNYVSQKMPDVIVKNYQYGFLFPPHSWVMVLLGKFSFFRRKQISRFQDYLLRVRKDFPDYNISIVAHSFGSQISYYAINREPELRIKNYTILQGVISSHAEKSGILNWVESGRIDTVHATSSPNDVVVNKVALPPFGKLGARGFVLKEDKPYKKPRFQPYPSVAIYNHHGTWNHHYPVRNMYKEILEWTIDADITE